MQLRSGAVGIGTASCSYSHEVPPLHAAHRCQRQCISQPRGLSHARRSIRCDSSHAQAERFRASFQPSQSNIPEDFWLTWPLWSGKPPASNGGANGGSKADGGGDSSSPTAADARGGAAVTPAATLPDTAVRTPNPHAQHFYVAPLDIPGGAGGFPGRAVFAVSAAHDYSREAPKLWYDDDSQRFYFRKGFLGGLTDPHLIPSFVYQGLEVVQFSGTDRLLQLVITALYAAAHVAVLGALWQVNPLLSAAVALNWARGTLTVATVVVLAALACSGRLWMYFTYLAAKAIDAGLAKLAPPLRRFFWANFTLWIIYVALSPTHWYPLPLPPFMPGSMGAQEAFQ